MVACRDRVHTMGEHLKGGLGRDPYASGQVLAIDDEEIRPGLLNVLFDSLPARFSYYITQEKYCKIIILHILLNVSP